MGVLIGCFSFSNVEEIYYCLIFLLGCICGGIRVSGVIIRRIIYCEFLRGIVDCCSISNVGLFGFLGI